MQQYWMVLEENNKKNLFKPQTGRPPKERDNQPIHDHLISEGKKIHEKHEVWRSQEFSKYKNQNPDVDTWSVKMLESWKAEIVANIFDQLDKNHEGKISSNNLDLNDLSSSML